MPIPRADHQAMRAECHRTIIGVSCSVRDAQGTDRDIPSIDRSLPVDRDRRVFRCKGGASNACSNPTTVQKRAAMFIRVGYQIDIQCKTDTVLILRAFAAFQLAGTDVRASFGAGGTRSAAGGLPRLVRQPADAAARANRSIEAVVGTTSSRLTANPTRSTGTRNSTMSAICRPKRLQFLTASRYCDFRCPGRRLLWSCSGSTQARLGTRAGDLQPRPQPADSSATGFGRPTKTASDAQREKTGVCRDFAHLAIAFCRAMNIPARYGQRLSRRHRRPLFGAGPTSAPGSKPILMVRWYTFDARLQTRRASAVC